METLWQDLRYGARMLVRNPGFAAVALVTLALGIGANTAIFSVVNAVVLRPLPYHEPDRLVMLWQTLIRQGGRQMPFSLPTLADYRKQSQAFEDHACYGTNLFNYTGGEQPDQLSGAIVSTQFFSVLGVNAALGRTFLPEEERQNVAVISHRLWQQRFGSDPKIIGRPIRLNNQDYSVVGVMPPGFDFPPVGAGGRNEAEVWTTLAYLPPGWAESRGTRAFRVVARLKPGVSFEQGQAEASAIAGRLEQEYPDNQAGVGVKVVPLHEQLVGRVRPALLALLGAVGFVLLIACANVANLLLARTAARGREVAIRTALGAGRGRLVRQVLTESTLLAFMGGAAGLLLALVGVAALTRLGPANIPRLDEVGVDRVALGFTLAVSLLTGVAFGLAPALQTSRLNINELLKEGGKAAAGGARGRRLRRLLVVAEIALAVVLLVGAGLMGRSFLRLTAVNPGFEPAQALSMAVTIAVPKYTQPEQRVAFFREALGRIERLPGVVAAGGSIGLPPNVVQRGTGFTVEGQPTAPGEMLSANFQPITSNYFRALNAPLLKGRPFTEQDGADAPGVVIVNETFARRFFAGEEALGKRLRLGGETAPWLSVVGVIADIRYAGLEAEPGLSLYVPYAQQPFPWLNLVVRTASDPLTLSQPIRNEIRELDKDVPVTNIKTMEQVLSESVAQPRFNTLLLGLFAAVALVLALVGIYGVMSYTVTQHTHEIGVRMALGARPRDVLRLVVGQGLVLAGAGLALGLAGAAAVTRLLSSLLFGISATDPATFIGIALLLLGVAALACYVPARRAMKVDPMVALRYE